MPFNTVSTARAVVLGTETQFSGTVNPASPFAYYRIDVEGRSSLRVSLTALGGNANLEVVRDSDGNGTIENAEILHRSTNGGAIAEALSPILEAGTYFVRVVATTDSTNYQLSISASNHPSNELVWRNTRTGENGLWSLSGTSVAWSQLITGVSDLSWRIAGTGDFNQDGHTDLVWRNTRTGENGLWFMHGTSVLSMTLITGVPDLNWQIVGTADFNQDNRPDLVWRNIRTGENGLWFMNGTSILSTTYITGVPDLNWQIVGTGDFNQDNRPDLVWRNIRTGENGLWFMNGTSVLSMTLITGVPDLNWQIVGTGDFNQDGRPDLVWRNTRTGENGLWFMDGTSILSTTFILGVPDLNWQISGTRKHFNQPLALDIAGNDRAKAFNIGTLNSAALFNDRLSTSDTDDFYQFNLTEISRISSELMEATASLQLLDANGNLLQASGTNRSIESQLNPGTYFVRVFQPTALAVNYLLSLSGIATPIHRYDFVYYYNGQDNTADYYTGSVIALANTYRLNQFYDVNPAKNETGSNGRYYITGVRVESTIADLGKVFVNRYYDVNRSGITFTPNTFLRGTHAGNNYLGSEVDFLDDAQSDAAKFGQDLLEANPSLITTSNLTFSRREGDSGTFQFRLAIAPTSNVTVTFTGGHFVTLDADNTISNGTQNSITFTPTDWNIHRTLWFIAEQDSSASDRVSGNTISYTLSGGQTDSGVYDLGTITNTYSPDPSRFNIDLDFRNDYVGFWTAARRAVAQRAASDWASRILSELAGYTLNNQTISMYNPNSSDLQGSFSFISNRFIDDLVVFVGAYSTNDGWGGWGGTEIGGWSASEPFPRAGMFTVNASEATQYSDSTLYSLVAHEIGHVLGLVNQTQTGNNLIDQTTTTFKGEFARRANGGAYVPLQSSYGHPADSVRSIMSYAWVYRLSAPTEIDFAMLADLGYGISSINATAGFSAIGEQPLVLAQQPVAIEQSVDQSVDQSVEQSVDQSIGVTAPETPHQPILGCGCAKHLAARASATEFSAIGSSKLTNLLGISETTIPETV